MVLKVIQNDNFYKAISYTSENVRLFVVIDDVTLGPALGGCRMLEFLDEKEALHHVARLAKAMTYKNAVVDLPFGGGKALIYQWNHQKSRNEIFREFADVLNYINGEYYTADDVNTTVKDMDFLRKYTKFARGVFYKGQQIPATSFGVYQAIKAASSVIFKTPNLKGINVFVQGLGKVGYSFVKLLRSEQANVFVYDIQPDIVQKSVDELGCIACTPDIVYRGTIDILSPCALGNSITKDNIQDLKVKLIAGGANNQLENPSLAQVLYDKNIVYIPDFLCNAGGVIDVDCEGENYCPEYVYRRVGIIYDKTISFLNKSKENSRPVLDIALDYVHSKLKGGK